jgi:hypothetical protein
VDKVLHRAARLQHTSSTPSRCSLSKLKNVHILNSGPTVFAVNSILPFLQIKSVRTFICNGLDDNGRDLMNGRGPSLRYPSSVETVCFAMSNMPAEKLEKLLHNFPHLKRLSYHTSWTRTRSRSFLLPSVRDGISHLEDQLEGLALTNMVGDWTDSTGETFEPIGSLSNFQKLVFLHVSAYVLLGRQLASRDGLSYPHYATDANRSFVSNLPNSIRKLALTECCEGIFDTLHQIILRVATDAALPHLKTVLVEFPAPFSLEKSSRPWEFLLAEFPERGIQLNLLSTDASGAYIVLN